MIVVDILAILLAFFVIVSNVAGVILAIREDTTSRPFYKKWSEVIGLNEPEMPLLGKLCGSVYYFIPSFLAGISFLITKFRGE